MKIKVFMLIGLLFAMNFVMADTGLDTGALDTVMCNMVNVLRNLLGPLSFLLIVAAALVYAGGQLGDAQIRAKATGWATMGIIGAVIAFMISVVGPEVIRLMYTGMDDCYAATFILLGL